MYTIKIKKENSQWLSIHDDPEVKELFGTDTIPLPYNENETHCNVLRAIRKLNPDRNVIFS